MLKRQYRKHARTARFPAAVNVFKLIAFQFKQPGANLFYKILAAHLEQKKIGFRGADDGNFSTGVNKYRPERLEDHPVAVDINFPYLLVGQVRFPRQRDKGIIFQETPFISLPVTEFAKTAGVYFALTVRRYRTYDEPVRHSVQLPVFAIKSQQTLGIAKIHYPLLVPGDAPVLITRLVLRLGIILHVRHANAFNIGAAGLYQAAR